MVMRLRRTGACKSKHGIFQGAGPQALPATASQGKGAALLRLDDGSSKLMADSHDELRRAGGVRPAPFGAGRRPVRSSGQAHSASPHIRPLWQAQCTFAALSVNKQVEGSARRPSKGRRGVCVYRGPSPSGTQPCRAGLTSGTPTALDGGRYADEVQHGIFQGAGA